MLNPSLLPTRLTAGFASLLCMAAVLSACGGGGSDSSSSTTQTATAFSAGPITGFGSVIVNGVRFDDSAAKISDDDGAAHERSELKLGMMAEVEAADVKRDNAGSGSGRAIEIRIGAEIVGPATAVDVAGKTLTVIGQTVDVTDNTLFDERITGGLAGISVGTIVEVNGVLNAANGHFTATRIEPKPNAPFFKVRGMVAKLDTKLHTFEIGGAKISYDTIAAVAPAGLADGQLVRVKVQTTQVAGAWVAISVKSGVRKIENHDEAEVHGLITAFTSATKFSVNGIAVDASNAVFPKGQTGVVLGARVEVEGKAVDGVIIATKVSVEDENEEHKRGFELHGAITELNGTAKTFVLRGVTVDFGGTVEFRKGSAATLALGSKVEVKGMLSADGKTLTAVRISFED